MKKITLLLILIVFAGMANASIYLDEVFDYPDGALKTNTGWLTGGTTTWESDYMVQGSALTYSDVNGSFVLSGQGKVMSCDYQTPYGSSNYTVYKSFSETAITTGTVYVSFLYSPNGVSQGQSQAPAMSISVPGTNTGVQVWVGKGVINTSDFRFGTTRGSTTSSHIVWSATEYSDLNASYLVVLKYDLDTQTSTIYINPALGTDTEPTPHATDNASTSSIRTSVQTIQFKTQGSSKEVYVAGSVRVASTWAEAVAIQSASAEKLTAPVVGTTSEIGAESFKASWSAVANAVGYTVKVYKGEVVFGSFDVDGQATESLVVKGLLTNTTYTYSVVAKGDGENYLHSDESAASTEFTTLEGLTAIHTAFNDGSWGTLYNSENQPASGSFPSSAVNGFDLSNTFLYDISKYDSRGDLHQYGMRMDKMSNGGMVILPTVKSIEQVEIHAIPGGAPRDIALQELVDGVWTLIETFTLTSSAEYKELIIPISRAIPTKLRIVNMGSGQVTIYQVITRTTNPVLLSTPVVGDPTNIDVVGFLANWTAVTNATGYKLKIYQGSSLVRAVDVTGQSTESVDVRGLEPETEYSYKVLAVGDDFNLYADSYLSEATTPFITTVTTAEKPLGLQLNLYAVGRTLFSNTTGMLELISLQGSVMMQSRITTTLETSLPTGLYIVRFTDDLGVQTSQKVIIK